MTASTPLWVSGPSNAPLPPLAPGLPLLGNALNMMNDPLSYLVACYQQLGPIYRIRALNREMTVLAGIEANQFLARVGDELLSSEALFGGFAREMGTRVFLVALDGAAHRRLRKLMRRALQPGRPHLPGRRPGRGPDHLDDGGAAGFDAPGAAPV